MCSPNLCSISKFHFWYCGLTGRCEAENNPGGENPGTDALSWVKVAPLLKPARNAALEAAAALKRLFASPGARFGVAALELTAKMLNAGEFWAKLSTITAGNASQQL